jgi:hypothetical protein
MSNVMDIPEHMKPPTDEQLKELQVAAESVVRGLYQFFSQNKIDKGVAAVAMSMVLDNLAKEGYVVQTMPVKLNTPEGLNV